MGRVTQVTAACLALVLSGCATVIKQEPPLPEPNEFRIALAQLSETQLAPCSGIGARPGDAVGDLLQDFNEAAAVGAECMARQRTLADYVRPLVKKAQQPD